MKKTMSVPQSNQNRDGKDGQNRELSLEILEAKKRNLITDEIIVSSASESTEKEPIFYNFIPIPEKDQLQVNQENMFATKTHHESEEVSTELKLGSSVSTESNKNNFIPIPENDQLQVSRENVFATKTHHESDEVSTELPLGYGSYITKKSTANENLANSSVPSTSCGIKRMKLNDQQVEKGEGPIGFDPWVIKKRITESEIQYRRLRLPVDGVRKHNVQEWDARRIDSIKNGEEVAVWDCDTKSEHQLIFDKQTAYRFGGKWTDEFVLRGGLKKDDEIGLYWDPSNSRVCFSILKWASSD